MVLYEIFTVGKFTFQVYELVACSITLHNSSSVHVAVEDCN